MESAGLTLGVVKLVEEVGHGLPPAPGCPMEGVDTVGEVLQSHAGTVLVWNVVLEGECESRSFVGEEDEFPSDVVAKRVYLIAPGGILVSAPSGDDAEVVREAGGLPAVFWGSAGPLCPILYPEGDGEARKDVEGGEEGLVVQAGVFHMAIVAHEVVGEVELKVQLAAAARDGDEVGVEVVARQIAAVARVDDVAVAGSNAVEAVFGGYHPKVETQFSPGRTDVALIEEEVWVIAGEAGGEGDSEAEGYRSGGERTGVVFGEENCARLLGNDVSAVGGCPEGKLAAGSGEPGKSTAVFVTAGLSRHGSSK